MGEMSQSHAERVALDAQWNATPEVSEFSEHAEAFAWRNNLKFDKAGMDAIMAFSQEWFKNHGPLPDSGILAG
jgi:hypothetical protein